MASRTDTFGNPDWGTSTWPLARDFTCHLLALSVLPALLLAPHPPGVSVTVSQTSTPLRDRHFVAHRLRIYSALTLWNVGHHQDKDKAPNAAGQQHRRRLVKGECGLWIVNRQLSIVSYYHACAADAIGWRRPKSSNCLKVCGSPATFLVLHDVTEAPRNETRRH
ncbi:hypothetical protein F5Y09DRAFT_342056 [Xylaria sp. FL1042]|nr:hypothetical protein F5Y09DRAFT_342056 [Xylaria sp. FL1042]